jgi:hypothetical protein
MWQEVPMPVAAVSCQRVKEIAGTPRAYSVLDSGKIQWLHGKNWANGGCWLFATALRRLFGSGELWAIVDAKGSALHVVLRLGPRYIDAAGEHGDQELLETWRVEGGKRLVRLGRADTSKLTPGTPEQVIELARVLAGARRS